MSNDLLIKINADAKNAKKAFDDMRDQTQDLESTLNKVAVGAGVAFAALTAEVYFSVKAFEEAQQASIELENALQNQGIYTDELAENYDKLAKAIQEKTGMDDDAVKKSFAVAQSYLGQREITGELAEAIADLGAKMGGDLNGAAEKIARTIGTGTNAFARQGLVISESATEAERYSKVLEFVQNKAGGLAAELDKADGYTKRLTNAFGNAQESIGERFAPAVAKARLFLANLFQGFSENAFLGDFAAAAIAAGLAVTGIITAASVAVPAFLALKAAAIAVGLSMSVAFVGIPLAIAAIVAGVTFLVQHWDNKWTAIKAITVAAVTAIAELMNGLGKVLYGAITFNPSRIKEGLNDLKLAFKKANQEYVAEFKKGGVDLEAAQKEQEEKKKAAADREAAEKRRHQANLRAIDAAELQLLKLQNENASAAQIDLKRREIEVLKALDTEESSTKLAQLRIKHEEIKALQDQQFQEDLQRMQSFKEVEAQIKADLEAQGIEADAAISEQKMAALQASLLTEADAERKIQEEQYQYRIEQRNRELLDRKKYGEAVAAINKVLYSQEVQGAKNAASELVQLQSSKSKELKEIGKVAAIAQIGISTAESAMNIYRGFSTIPIIGPALGVAGAAAAIAFGGERIAQVTSANQGGAIPGAGPDIDSQLLFATPGEFVTPRKNYDETVNAVASSRIGEVAGGNDIVAAINKLEEKLENMPRGTTNVFQGDVHNDDSYVDAFVKKISDAVEFRNARIVGVNA